MLPAWKAWGSCSSWSGPSSPLSARRCFTFYMPLGLMLLLSLVLTVVLNLVARR